MTTVNFKLSNPVHFLALGFGAGLLKPAPGTWGTLVAIPLYAGCMLIPAISIELYLLITFSMCLLGVYLCGKTARDVGAHDHGAIVWDEIAGYFITMIAVPFSWYAVLIGFILFRLFDIVKPWPIKLIDQKVHGGFGIMLDDVLAGLFACACLHIILYWI